MSLVSSLHQKSDTPITLERRKRKKPDRLHGRSGTPNSGGKKTTSLAAFLYGGHTRTLRKKTIEKK